MVSPILSTVPFWPRHRQGVVNTALAMSDPGRVALNLAAISALPKGEVISPPVNRTVTGVSSHRPSLASVAEFHIARNAINYRFWSLGESGDFVRYQHGGEVGALAMFSAFATDWKNPVGSLWAARAAGQPLTGLDVEAIFGAIPDPSGRARLLNEVLLSPDLFTWSHHIEWAARKNTADLFSVPLAAGLADSFPQAFGDPLLKKAQLAVSNIWREANDRGFQAPCHLTAFADYQIPNVLRAMGMLTYAPDLAARIDAGDLIPANSPDEQALRGASILAVDLLAESQGVNVADVDYWLWVRRKEPVTPFHRTLTTAY